MDVLIDGHMIGEQEGGNETYTINLFKSLYSLSEVNVNLLTTPDHADEADINLKNVFSLLTTSNFVRLFFNIPYLVKKYHIDIVHTNYILPFLKNAKCVVTIHDLCFRKYPEYFNLREKVMFYFLLPISLQQADAIIVPSKFTKKEFSFFYPQLSYKVYVTYEAVDPYFHQLDKQEAKKKLQNKYTDLTDTFVFCLNSKIPKKNINGILKAFNMLLHDFSGLQLVIVGGTSHIDASLLNEHVLILDYIPQEDLNNFYNACGAFIYYSNYEGFGLPLLEAMHCKTPLIASDIEIHHEIAGDGALYAQPNNPVDLSKKIKMILTQDDLVEKLTTTGSRIEKKYSWEKTAIKTKNIYHTVLENKI